MAGRWKQRQFQYFAENFKKAHKNVVIMESGLKICKDMLFFGGSLDRIVICSCCGRRSLEVKCPFATRHLSPTDKDAILAFMTTDENGKYHLKKSHSYYTQCQVQMAVTGVTNNIFHVWTPHGEH